MDELKWNDSLLLGINLIDDQHQEIFKRFDRFFQALEEGQDKKAAIQLMGFVQIYVKRHFKDEEEYMEANGFPGVNSHKKLHVHFVEQFSSLQVRFLREGPTEEFIGAFKKNIVLWLVNHIRTVDQEAGTFLLTNAAPKGILVKS